MPSANITGLRGFLPFAKVSKKIWLEGTIEQNFSGLSVENFRERRTIWKDSLGFLVGMFQRSFKAIFDTSFPLSRLFFGKWNWFVQISGNRNYQMPVLNFAYPFTQTVDNRFAM